MALSMQDISDRMEINDVLVDYCSALDRHKFAELDRLFTADASIDSSDVGGVRGEFTEYKAYLKKLFGHLPRSQHMLGNIRIWLDGDSARARSICHTSMRFVDDDGNTQFILYGLWYADKLQRTEQGWRICERKLEHGYEFNVPEQYDVSRLPGGTPMPAEV